MAENSVCHVEFFSQDNEQASQFYSKLFGWKLVPYSDTYKLYECEGGIGGAFITGDDPAPKVRVYIEVADIEAKLTEAVAAGGKLLVPKTKIDEENGYFGQFEDPFGLVVGLWSAT